VVVETRSDSRVDVLEQVATSHAATSSRPGAAPLPGPHRRGSPSHVLRLEAREGWPRIDYRELWAYRGLFFFLVWRDVKVRYAQTVLGAGWAIIQPVMTMVVFTIIFGNIAQIPSDGVPYPIFSLAALVPWTFFSGGLSGASGSLVANANLLTKVYFPRLIIPLSRVLSGLTTFSVSFLILIAMQVAYGIIPSAKAIVVLPILILIMMMTAAGVGCWLAALQIQYRDVGTITGFMVRAWMYASPIVYPLSLVPESYRTIYMLNPLVAVIEGFRSVLLGTQPLNAPAIALGAAISTLLFLSGILYFRSAEDRFADVV
jgi:lipopolysaccharide transport system permease protein